MTLIDLFRPRPTIVQRVSVSPASVLGRSVDELYRTQPALRAVVGFLADNVASLPLKVYDRAGETDRPRVTEGVVPELLARPNATTTPQQLWDGITHDELLYGSALLYLCPSVDLASGWEMTYIPWSWVINELTEDGLSPSAFVIQNPDSMRAPVTLRASSCVLFRTYHPLGPNRTSSPVDALRQVLSEQISAWNFRNGVWKNGGRVSQVLTRPQGAEWTPDAKKRFAKSWKERFSGEEGTNTGGTPLLEDGMKLESVQFNAREAQWQEATRLSREDVAAVYHVNPSLIWHTDGQTYASAKDNARALYADTLAPILNMNENVLNCFLLPMIGAPTSQYVEFDIEAKLAGSFEERASVLQSAVGGPWMTRNEARAKLNMPALDGGDELIVPLNVVEGGLAAPNDTDPTVARNGMGAPGITRKDAAGTVTGNPTIARADDADAGEGVVILKSHAEASESGTFDIEGCLARFLERQCRSVVGSLSSGGPKTRRKGAGDAYPFWWDAARWNRELADDLEPIFRAVCDVRGTATMSDIGEPPDSWDSARTANFVRAMAERRADLFNETTYEELAAALMEFEEGDPSRITAAERAFLDNAANRAKRGAQTFATACAGFATKEAVRQRYPTDTDKIRRTKTWRHHGSKSPRIDHAAMDGETVGLDETFSNGADYPGDLALDAKDAVNCHCTMQVRVLRLGGGARNPSPTPRRGSAAIDRTADVYKGLATEQLDVIEDRVANAPENVRKLWQRFEHDFKKPIIVSDDDVRYEASDQTVRINLAQAFELSATVPGDDWFHEFAHNIDNLCGPRRYAYFSRQFEGGLLGDTIKSEVEEYCRGRLMKLPSVFADMAWVGRYEELFDNGKGPIDFDTYIKADVGVYSPQDVIARLGRPTMEMAYRSVSEELDSLNDAALADVLDLFEGATDGAVSGRWGHKADDDKYWVKLAGTRRLSSEGFAEMFSATMANGESLGSLRRYLPKSYDVFERMLGEMVML